MLCMHCMGREATIYIEDVNAGTRVGLCVECAAQGCSVNISAEAAAPHLLAQFLGVLHHGEESGPEIGTAEAACPECGLTRRELHVSGVLGCPACYLFFADEIGRQLETMHRGGRHCGLAPEASAQGAGARSLANLRRQLDQAIGDEAYERAAELRDAIREHAEQRKDGEGVKS